MRKAVLARDDVESIAPAVVEGIFERLLG